MLSIYNSSFKITSTAFKKKVRDTDNGKQLGKNWVKRREEGKREGEGKKGREEEGKGRERKGKKGSGRE